MSLADAFGLIIKLQSEVCQVRAADGTAYADVIIAKANMNRKLQGIEDSTFDGYEFVFTKTEADRVGWTEIRVGDRITTPTMGRNSITKIIPQIVLGNLIGYRVWTG